MVKDETISDGSALQRRRSTRNRIRPDRFGSSSGGDVIVSTSIASSTRSSPTRSATTPASLRVSPESVASSIHAGCRSECIPDTPGSEPPVPDPAVSSSSCPVSVTPEAVVSAVAAAAAVAAISKSSKRKRPAAATATSVSRPTPEECAFAVAELGKLHPDVIAKCREIKERTTVTTNVASDCAIDKDLGVKKKDLGVKNEKDNKDENHGATSSALQPSTCGDQPSILDGVVSTMLSQNTTAANSTRAFANLKKAVPDWNLVVQSSGDEQDDKNYQQIIERAIHCAGLSQIRASNIFALCQTLRDETGTVSLEYLRHRSNQEIQTELLRFKGLGPKTVSCVLLFTLGRADFPVDTHVFRIAKQHRWLSAKSRESSSRDAAYEYLNRIVPDPLKLELHCLLVQHGRECHRCAARGKPQFPPKDGTKLVCPMVHLDGIAAGDGKRPKHSNHIKQEP